MIPSFRAFLPKMSTKYPSINKEVFQLSFQSYMMLHEKISAYNHYILTSIRSTLHACRICRRRGFDPWVGKILWRKSWQPTPAFLPGESNGQRNPAGSSLWGHKEWDTTEQLTLSLSGALYMHVPFCHTF